MITTTKTATAMSMIKVGTELQAVEVIPWADEKILDRGCQAVTCIATGLTHQ